MRRIFVLLFFTLTAFQLAFAGMPVAASAVQADSHWASSEGELRAADHQLSHHNVTDSVPEAPCDTLQVCTVCGACQLCHQAAQPDAQVLAMAPRVAGPAFPPTVTRYLSAEHAPSLKPPIL